MTSNAAPYTSRNAADARMHAQYLAERATLEAKVKHWRDLYARFGGEVHWETLQRLEAQLAAL